MRKQSARHMQRQRGFTLIEVSVALLLLSMVLTFVYQSFILTLQTKARVEKRSETFQAARVALQRMEREIQSAYVEINKGPAVAPVRPPPIPGQPGQPPAQPGLPEETGGLNSVRTAFYGQSTDSEGYPRDRLDFTTFAHYAMAAAGEDDRQSDHEEVAYWAETDYKENRTDLLHRSDFTMDDDPLGGGDIFPLIEGIRGLNFRFLSPESNDWTDTWDSRSSGSLPAAVEISLWIENPSNEKEPFLFSKVVRVPLHTPGGLNKLQLPANGTTGEGQLDGSGGGKKGGLMRTNCVDGQIPTNEQPCIHAR